MLKTVRDLLNANLDPTRSWIEVDQLLGTQVMIVGQMIGECRHLRWARLRFEPARIPGGDPVIAIAHIAWPAEPVERAGISDQLRGHPGQPQRGVHLLPADQRHIVITRAPHE